ncbi:MAG: hypothetical protein IJW05_02795 [Lentisphaeria bacterium]|nr:hypothetical protein [Lentisphaeria bacterium]
MKNKKIFFLTFAAVAVILLSGCSTVINAHRQKKDMMASYDVGNYTAALNELDSYLKPPSVFNSSRIGSGDEIMWRLEAGSLYWLVGKEERTIDHLSEAEKLIADYDNRAIVNLRQVGSELSVLVTNVNAIPYRGLCRDRVLLPVYKALAYLGKNDEEGFRVELFRLRETQTKVQEDYRRFFEAEDEALQRAKQKNTNAAQSADQSTVLNNDRNSSASAALDEAKRVAHKGYGNFMNPFTIFLSGYGYLRENDWENAHVDFARLYQALPDNSIVQKYYVTILKKTSRQVPEELKNVTPFDESHFNQNSVLVIFANGKTAALKQIALYIPIILPGYATIATTAWPVCEYFTAPFQELHVTSGNQQFKTVPIADMDGIFSQEYTERLPLMITRIALSTAVKEIGSYIATRAAARAHPLAGLAVAIGTSTYKAVVNTADTRTWEILPKEYQITQFAMPENREIVIAPDGGRPMTIKIPETAKSAIVYVNAPTSDPKAFTYRVLEHKAK